MAQPPGPDKHQYLPTEDAFSYPAIAGPNALDLGSYRREAVSNVDLPPVLSQPEPSGANSPGDGQQQQLTQPEEQQLRRQQDELEGERRHTGRDYFDFGLRLMLSYQHEMASKCFLACLERSPHCALAHGLIALCHSPNYNFKGDPYYESACHYDDVYRPDMLCTFPSQQVAERHSKMAIDKVEELRRLHRGSGGGGGKKKGKKGKKGGGGGRASKAPEGTRKNGGSISGSSGGSSLQPTIISDVEVQLLTAIRVLTCCPGVDPALAEETVGRPFADAMRRVYEKYPRDPEIVYCFAESLMVLNAWQLYEYPSGRPVSPDVEETRAALERALEIHPSHAGLCHLYVHLSEMSKTPELALPACVPLRTLFPDAGASTRFVYQHDSFILLLFYVVQCEFRLGCDW